MKNLNSFPDEETCWQAVIQRSRPFDSAFVYGVRSTHIYCRPTCPSRRPAKDQVQFFPDAQAAEKAGFRACRRCRPQEQQSPSQAVVTQVRALLDAADHPLTLNEISEALNLSPFHIQRLFKSETGITPHQYSAALRAERFKVEIRQQSSVTTALYNAGYTSSSRAYEAAPAAFGMTPARYQKGGLHMQIYYQFTQTPLGALFIAATNEGICSVQFSDDEAVLLNAFQKEFPKAQIFPTSNASESFQERMGQWEAALQGYLQGIAPIPSLPLAVLGTAFQNRVWRELQQIPAGETRTYAQVAQTLGQPSAVRAVARACATNPVALLVPCHRVIRSDGSLAGYRWGLPRKQALLTMEKTSQVSASESHALSS